jgi:hypothetical protein
MTSTAIALAAAACTGAPKAVERVEPSPGEVELSAGEYELVVIAGTNPVEESRGRLSLRATSASATPAYRQQYPLYGWTSVDFIKIGAPVDVSAGPESKDPDNPGVLVLSPGPGFKELQERNAFRVARPWDAPIMLVGTLENTQATRGGLDGGGIGLFVQSKKGRCAEGSWASWGGDGGGRNLTGSFTLCALS